MTNLLVKHWWIWLVLAALSLFGSYIYANVLTDFLAPTIANYFRYLAIAFVFISIYFYYLSYERRKLLTSQTGLDSIRQLSWRKFEDLITEAYKQNGYKFLREPLSGSDKGIDIIVQKEGVQTIIQCKQWRSRKLGVKVVREMYGILSGSNADEVHIVSTGRVTNDALSFARGKPIKLIYGRDLLNLISDAQKNTPEKSNISETEVTCPECGSEMVLRKARKGKNAGNEFWGCIQFPKCRGTVSITS